MNESLTVETVRKLVPLRPEDGHKGTFGHVFVIGASRGLTGAVRLACEAAYRSGAGLVSAGIPCGVADILATVLVEAMSVPLPQTESAQISDAALDRALGFAAGKAAVVLGPGLGQHPSTTMFVQAFCARCPAPLLLDADGLNALGGKPQLLRSRENTTVLTPHPGEMARLMNTTTAAIQSDRESAAATLAKESGAAVVLKGRGTVIVGPEGRSAICELGNSGMATGGTGDVLSGIIGGLLAQALDGHEAACLGVFLHALAGDMAADAKTPQAMIARDIIEYLPAAWKALSSERKAETP